MVKCFKLPRRFLEIMAITTIIASRPNRLTPAAARLPGHPGLIAMDDEPYETHVISNCEIVFTHPISRNMSLKTLKTTIINSSLSWPTYSCSSEMSVKHNFHFQSHPIAVKETMAYLRKEVPNANISERCLPVTTM